MSQRTAVPERVSERAKSARRAGALNGQAVGDYVGQPAGEAAQAVRRAGLRPGLDRSFGCPAELRGLVVAQDPTAGSELARNGMVTLYVAAPGSDPLHQDTDDSPVAGETPDGKPMPTRADVPSQPTRARRRKRTRVRQATAPARAGGAAAAAETADLRSVEQVARRRPGVQPPEVGAQDELADDANEREGRHEALVAQAQDVLAGRAGPPDWRRVYLRRSARAAAGGRVRRWLAEHRLLVGAVAVALLLWMIVGIASTPAGGSHPPAAGASSPRSTHASRHRSPRPKPAARPMARTREVSPRRAYRAAKRARARGRSPRTARRVALRAPGAGASVAAPPPAGQTAPTVPPRSAAASDSAQIPVRQAPPAGISPRVPAPEQSGGGPFSP